MITTPGSTGTWRGRYQTADGAWKWVETVNHLDDSDSPTVITTMTRVAAERASVEEELRAFLSTRYYMLVKLFRGPGFLIFSIEIAMENYNLNLN